MRDVAGGRQVIGEAATNTISDYNGMPVDSTGMDRYRELQDQYREIINGYDARVTGSSSMITDYFANPSSPQSFPSMIADGEFTEREATITERNLENLVKELEGIKRAFQSISERESNRDPTTNVYINDL